MANEFEEIVVLEIANIQHNHADCADIKNTNEGLITGRTKETNDKKDEVRKVRFMRKTIRTSSASEALPESSNEERNKRMIKKTQSEEIAITEIARDSPKHLAQKNKSQLLCCCGPENCEEETKSDDTKTGPKDWEVKEWHAILRENYLCMCELNLQQKRAKLKTEIERIEAERVKIQEKADEVNRMKRALERRELQIEEKKKLLEIAIRVNEINFESRVEELENECETVHKTPGTVVRRTYYTQAENKTTEIDFNNVESEGNTTESSNETNSPSSH